MALPNSLQDWCTYKVTNKAAHKDIRTLFMLVLWELWTHRNAVVFDGAAPSTLKVLKRIVSEARAWKQARLLRGEVEAFMLGLASWESSK